MHKFELKGLGNNTCRAEVLVDGIPVKATEVNLNMVAGVGPAIVEITSHVLPDIELMADVKFDIVPRSIENAVELIRCSLMTNEDYYNGFAASIKSALDDIEGSMNHECTAKVILDRIIGKG